jgi:VWFA-related protein
MKKLTSLVVAHALLVSLLAPLVWAQQTTGTPQTPAPSAPTQTPQQRASDDEDVVRITTNLVQVDAVVVDKKGKQVTDLTAEDFEIYEDKRPQQITNFSYVLNEAAPRPTETADAPRIATDKKSAPLPEPPRRLRPEQVRRTMALVVDDLGLSFESTAFVRDALRKFVNEQMQPNDLVAIIRTSAGVGALQQFTSDKRQLHAAIDRVKWYMSGRGGISAFARIESSPEMQNLSGGARNSGLAGAREAERDLGAELGDFREEIFAVGTLGALNFVVRGMRELPGRKSVLLLSEGFALFTPDRGRGRSDRVYQSMLRLTDLANRSSVVVYSIDPRGLVNTMLTAEDSVGEMSQEMIDQRMRERSDHLFDTQSGLAYLSQQTGGFLIKNNNDLTGGIRRVVEDQKGYYLLGYRPEGATFDRRFHRIAVKVKRPGLKVRSRTGFYGVRDEETRPVRHTRDQQLLAALTSPFTSADVRMRLTSFFVNSPDRGSYLRSMLYLDGRDLKFTKEPNGKYKATLDLVGMTFGDNGSVIDSYNNIHKLDLTEDLYQQLLRAGMIYTMNVPVKKPGAYQLRVAVRDAATERTGSASQFIEVPDLKKNRLALSGLVVSAFNRDETAKASATPTNATSASTASATQSQEPAVASAASEEELFGNPAVRRFRYHSSLAFGYVVYNARLDKPANRPHLTTQSRLFRDGQLVYTGAEKPFQITAQPADPKRLDVFGRLQLGSALTPGEYVLQVIVTDTLRNDKHRVATQWVDFEIYK